MPRDPTIRIAQCDGQSDESYQEQVFATNFFKSPINKYINPPLIDSTLMTHTKGVIVHGVPGKGKTHIAKLAFLHTSSKSLKIMSTSILGVHSSFLSVTQLDSFFCLTPQKHKSKPYRISILALAGPLLHHILLALDVLFIDKIGTLSNQQLAILEIMFFKHCNVTFFLVII